MNINAMMAQAKKMQAEMEKVQKEIEKKEFKVEKQGITIILTGDKIIRKIDINEALLDPEDKDILEDLMVIAINDGIKQIDAELDKATPQPSGGMPF